MDFLLFCFLFFFSPPSTSLCFQFYRVMWSIIVIVINIMKSKHHAYLPCKVMVLLYLFEFSNGLLCTLRLLLFTKNIFLLMTVEMGRCRLAPLPKMMSLGVGIFNGIMYYSVWGWGGESWIWWACFRWPMDLTFKPLLKCLTIGHQSPHQGELHPPPFPPLPLPCTLTHPLVWTCACALSLFMNDLTRKWRRFCTRMCAGIQCVVLWASVCAWVRACVYVHI